MILVATVEHSGTMRLLSILSRSTCPLSERERARPDDVLFAHLRDEAMPLIAAHQGIIVTTRRPEADIRASWERRGRDTEELERQFENYRSLLLRKPYVMELGQWQ